MNKRSISLYFVLLTAIINIFVFADFPKSHAKYIKVEDEIISYETTIKQLKLSTGDYIPEDNITLKSESVRDHAVLNISFNRSNSMYIDSNNTYSDKQDTYRFKVKDGSSCYIRNNSVSSSGTIAYNDTDEFSVTYLNNETDTITFILECDVTDSLYVAFDIFETITNYNNVKEEEFSYLEYENTISQEDYYSIVDVWHPIVKYMYTSAIEALEEKYLGYKDTTIMSELIEYFDTVFELSKTSDEAFISNASNLKGFTYDSSKENPYIFEDNYMGYALTSVRYNKLSDKTKYTFYFSENDSLSDLVRTSIFKDYYFDLYASNTLKENKDKVVNYINSYIDDDTDLLSGYAKMFRGSIFGINVSTSNNVLILSFTDAILTLINNEEMNDNLYDTSDTITLANKSGTKDEMYQAFKDALIQMSTDLITQNVSDKFMNLSSTNDPDWYRSIITRNSNETEAVTIFSFLYILEDNTLVNFYSTSTNTYTKFTKLDHNVSVLIAMPVGMTSYNTSFGTIINDIDEALGNNISITSWPSVYDTQVDENDIVHRYYIVNDITYDFFTEDNINYVRYTTK